MRLAAVFFSFLLFHALWTSISLSHSLSPDVHIKCMTLYFIATCAAYSIRGARFQRLWKNEHHAPFGSVLAFSQKFVGCEKMLKMNFFEVSRVNK